MGSWVDGQWKGTGWPQTVCPPARPEVVLTVATVPRPPPTVRKKDAAVRDIRRLGSRLKRAPAIQDDRALAQRAIRAWGSWANAVEAAGYDRPTRGSRRVA